ncbi:hypothetical protein [Stenotrophomonas acidaminiphila]|uniref:hypothetical protein n=1 Tax=Stenotrophomonas acidaminiphila TaxID=128780 RepID=UPI0020C60837|nr:hypothetical protein [Stenotrophomonas acidaminiphila]
MAVSFAFDGNDVVWTQRLERPAVYLDTFAIREIADSDELSARFVRALTLSGGTWLLASLSMGEFARFADPRHVERAERLLAQVVPRIYLFRSEPDVDREARGETDLSMRSLPRSEERNMDYFSRRWAKEQTFPDTFRGMFTLVYERRGDMKVTLDEIASKVVASLTRHRQFDDYRRNAKAARPDDGRTRQQVISGDLLRELVLDTNAPISNNDALDLMHAVEALDYCDLVLLDKAWERRVTALRQRIAQSGVVMPIAACFSKSNGGVERFLQSIEGWPDQAARGEM